MLRVCSFVGLAALAHAQQFVAELDPAPAVTSSSNARSAVAGNGQVWFTAFAADSGSELWRTDGTVGGTRLAVDFGPGVTDSQVQPLLEVGGTLLVVAADALDPDVALWATNGTAAGTVRLTGGFGYPNSNPSIPPRALGPVNGRALVIARGTLGSDRIWSTDFTAAGTQLLATTERIVAATVHGNEVLLLVTVAGVDHLYATDGTYFVDRLGIGGSADSNFARLGSHEYFLAYHQTQSFLLRTDGTATGTTVVAALGPPPPLGYDIDSIANLGSLLVFAIGGRLFRSDGTAAGTVPIPAPLTRAWGMIAVGTRVFFLGTTAAAGEELWVTDGTGAGTNLVVDLEPGAASSRYGSMIDVQGRLFAFVDGASWLLPARLLSSDGTSAGTQTMPIVNTPGSWSLAALGNECVATIALGSPPAQVELYATDGTPAGTRPLTSGQTRPGATFASSAAALGETLYFVAGEAAHGRELWRSDGTATGTGLVQDLVPGPDNGMANLVEFGGDLYFTHAGALYRSDGTAAGTTIAVQPSPAAPSAQGLVVSGGVMLFTTMASYEFRLWRTDGTPAGTVAIATTNQGIFDYRQVGALTYYTGQDNSQPLFARSDGTPNGTVVLGQHCIILGESGGRAVFGSVAGSNMDVRVTDGTVAGTQFLGNVASAMSSATLGGTVVFVDHAGQVHATDGATLVTLPVPRVAAAPVVGLDAIYLMTADPANGRALYRTDGTIAGTALAATVGAGVDTGVFSMQPIAAGNRLFLNANDGTSGFEPWISDGTPAGTARLADLAPNGNSNPQLLGVAGRRAFFLADDGVRGRELWSVDLGAVGAASAQPFARGCAGTYGVPRLAADGAPLIGNAAFALDMDRCVPTSLMVWIGGDGIGGLPIGGGCAIVPANIFFTLWTFTDAAGRARLPIPVPNSAPLVGLQLTMQGSALDPLGPSVYGSTVTPGLLLVLGS